MQGFRAALINEIEKMHKKNKITVVLIISVAVIAIGKLASMGMSGFGVGVLNKSTTFPMSVLAVLANAVLPLFTALVATDLFSSEFSHNTMKITMTRPISRFKLFSAKIGAIAFFVFINLMSVMLLSTIVGLIWNSSSLSYTGIVRIVVSYLVTLVPIMVIALMVVLLANIIKSSSTVFFISVLIYIASFVLGKFYSQYSSIFITSMLSWHMHWVADKMLIAKIIREFLIMLGYGIMFFTAGYYLFDKKNL